MASRSKVDLGTHKRSLAGEGHSEQEQLAGRSTRTAAGISAGEVEQWKLLNLLDVTYPQAPQPETQGGRQCLDHEARPHVRTLFFIYEH